MRTRLTWQVAWAPALALSVAAVLLVAQASARRRLELRLAAVTQMRETLDYAVLVLADRHGRTVRRANEVILEPRHANRAAMLAWTAEHYQREMERYLTETRAAIAAVHVPGADARLAADLARLGEQLTHVMEQARAIVPALDALLAAVTADDDDAVVAAAQELARGDRGMDGVLRVAQGIVRRAALWQTQQALAAPPTVPRIGWVLLALLAAGALLIALRPLLRVAQLTEASTPGPRASPEEHALATRLHALAKDRTALETGLGERTRELERTAQALRRADQDLGLLRLYNENLVNSLRAAIVVTDVSLAVRSFNRIARHCFALHEDMVGEPLDALPLFAMLGSRSTDGRAELERALASREALRYESLPLASSDGEHLFDLTIAPYMDESGAARGLLWVADDVTEAVQTKSQLLLAERLAAVGRLSAQVAHEVRNPLSAIGLNTELLTEDFAAELPEPRRSEARKLLMAINAEVERLSEVTEGYLRLARMPRPTQREVDLNLVVGDLVTMLRQEMNAAHVDVTLDLATPPPHAWTDPGQLRQALLNVVRNSREAMPQGGRLCIATRRADSGGIIEVADSGPGIAAAVLPRIFEPFFSTKVAGTGLGLSLTQQIIVENGGTVEARDGEACRGDALTGAVLTIKLPSRPPE